MHDRLNLLSDLLQSYQATSNLNFPASSVTVGIISNHAHFILLRRRSFAEGAGIVQKVGPAVRSVEAGDKVLLSPAHCRTNCKACRSGEPMQCSNVCHSLF
jgi:threonine dehydrogenase-like Zn-dependent dehydrogenase